MAATIDGALCERLISAATERCSAPVPVPAPLPVAPVVPNWDGITAGLNMLSTAFVLGSLVVALLAIIGGFAWSKIISADAEKEARKVAKEAATEVINAWLANEAGDIIREHLELLTQQDGDGDGQDGPSDEIAKAAG